MREQQDAREFFDNLVLLHLIALTMIPLPLKAICAMLFSVPSLLDHYLFMFLVVFPVSDTSLGRPPRPHPSVFVVLRTRSTSWTANLRAVATRGCLLLFLVVSART